MRELFVVMIGLSLGWIIIQDFRMRKVSLSAIIILFILCDGYFCLVHPVKGLPGRILLNSLFSIIILASGTLLVRIGRSRDSLSSLIGAGDFLFLIAISPMFSFDSYLVFLNASSTLTLIFYGLLMSVRKVRNNDTIPLAGALAACLILTLIINLSSDTELLEKAAWIPFTR